MSILANNDAISTLSGAISNVATVANLAAGTGQLFPEPTGDDYFVLTLTDQATGLIKEIVHVTERVGDQITIVRAQEGTNAVAWAANTIAANLMTAGQFAAMVQTTQLYPARVITASGAFVTNRSDGSIGLKRTVAPAASSTTLPDPANTPVFDGQVFTYQDLASNFQAYNLTVNAPAGTTIAGLNSYVASVNRSTVSFRWYEDESTWGVSVS